MQRSTTTDIQTLKNENEPAGQRIYAQMRPEVSGIHELENVQHALPQQNQGRLIGPDELHLTLIHFGKADDMYEHITRTHPVERARFDEALTRYITRTTATMPTGPIDLRFKNFDLFGPNHTTLVAHFQLCDTISELHTKLFGVLLDFLKQLDVPKPLEFVQNDRNLQHAMTCKPHVTLFKSFKGDAPTDTLGAMQFISMNVVY